MNPNQNTSEISFERPFRIRLSTHASVDRASQLVMRFTAGGWQGGIQHPGSTQPDLPFTEIEPPEKNASLLHVHLEGRRYALTLVGNQVPQGGHLHIPRSFIIARPLSEQGTFDETDIWVAEEEDPKDPPQAT